MRTPGVEDFDFIRETLGSIVPFAHHVGVRLDTVGDGNASASLPDEAFTKNHVGTQHAGALFTVAEAASGAAMAGALAPIVAEALSVVKTSSCRFLAPARGPITAMAMTRSDGADARADYELVGRTALTVEVTLRDAEEKPVAEMTFEWVVRSPT